jgi:ABC-2 type transport system ATP-binding protein
MRQKAKLAQALVHDPRLLFLDEPTNGLDPKGRDEMLDLIRDLAHRHGISVLLSSHLLPDVEYVCDDVVVMNRGAIIAQGDLEDLQKPEGSQWILRVKGQSGPMLQALKTAKIPAIEREGYIHLDLPQGQDANAVLSLAQKARTQVRHLTPKRSTLEDLFMQLVETEA